MIKEIDQGREGKTKKGSRGKHQFSGEQSPQGSKLESRLFSRDDLIQRKENVFRSVAAVITIAPACVWGIESGQAVCQKAIDSLPLHLNY